VHLNNPVTFCNAFMARHACARYITRGDLNETRWWLIDIIILFDPFYFSVRVILYSGGAPERGDPLPYIRSRFGCYTTYRMYNIMCVCVCVHTVYIVHRPKSTLRESVRQNDEK